MRCNLIALLKMLLEPSSNGLPSIQAHRTISVGCPVDNRTNRCAVTGALDSQIIAGVTKELTRFNSDINDAGVVSG
jgi:hypothetical protein